MEHAGNTPLVYTEGIFGGNPPSVIMFALGIILLCVPAVMAPATIKLIQDYFEASASTQKEA